MVCVLVAVQAVIASDIIQSINDYNTNSKVCVRKTRYFKEMVILHCFLEFVFFVPAFRYF